MNRRRVLVFGTFDLLHEGHRFLLAEAAKRGDLTVVVACDRTVERLKGRTPSQGEEERRVRVQQAVPHAAVILGDEENYRSPLVAVRPDLILLGYDQALPPGVTEADFPCPVERLPAFKPEKFKSSLRRQN